MASTLGDSDLTTITTPAPPLSSSASWNTIKTHSLGRNGRRALDRSCRTLESPATTRMEESYAMQTLLLAALACQGVNHLWVLCRAINHCPCDGRRREPRHGADQGLHAHRTWSTGERRRYEGFRGCGTGYYLKTTRSRYTSWSSTERG